jgi:hypothetical protein
VTASSLAPQRSESSLQPTRPPLGWWLVTLFALPIVGYAIAYVVVEVRVA